MARTYIRRYPPGVKRPKTGGRRKGTPNKATGLDKRPKAGGRRKGTPNKSTLAIREALLQVFADLQQGSGEANGHLMDWALRNATDFYKLSAKLLPRQVTVEAGDPAITRVELVAVRPKGSRGSAGRAPSREVGRIGRTDNLPFGNGQTDNPSPWGMG
jgi:hypothetical protein